MNLLSYVQHLFDRFAGEVGIFLAGVLIAKAKDGYSWVRNRYRPDGKFPGLVTTILRGSLRMRSASEGELSLVLSLVNLSGNRLILTHCQLNYLQFNGVVMAPPIGTLSSPRMVLSRHSMGQASVTVRLDKSDLASMYRASNVAANTRSAPGNKVRIGFAAVAERRFSTTTLDLRYLDSEELDIVFADSLASESL